MKRFQVAVWKWNPSMADYNVPVDFGLLEFKTLKEAKEEVHLGCCPHGCLCVQPSLHISQLNQGCHLPGDLKGKFQVEILDVKGDDIEIVWTVTCRDVSF